MPAFAVAGCKNMSPEIDTDTGFVQAGDNIFINISRKKTTKSVDFYRSAGTHS